MAIMNVKDPGQDLIPITPSDVADITAGSRALLIETGGALKVNTVNDNTRTINVPAGILPLQVKRVWSTGTTASNISAFY